jgi:hypothetical protein
MEDEKEKEVIRGILAKRIAQRDELNRTIEALQNVLGEAISESVQSVSSGTQPTFSQFFPQASLLIRPGEFFGMSQTEAAYSYLKRIGHAVHVEKILEALQAGGIKLEGKNPKNTLYTSLVRGTKRFVLVTPGTFGLAEFYPNRASKEK